MKRSKSLRLVLMGGAALTLGACEQPVEVGVFETVEQCTVMGYGESACESAIQQARKEHVQAAPKYATRADCEAEFGKCEPGQADGQQAAQQAGSQAPQQAGMGSYFMPLMAGYMMGRMMGGGAGMGAQPLYKPAGGAAAGGGFFTGAGSRIAGAPGAATVPQSAFSNARAATTTMARGGFGSRARSVSVAS